MSAPSASRLLNQAARSASRSIVRSRQANAFHLQPCRAVPAVRVMSCSRSFGFSASRATGLMPDTENPSTPQRESSTANLTAAELSDDDFHTLSDEFLEKVHEKAEQIQEGREDVEVEYAVSLSASVMRHIGSAGEAAGEEELTKKPPVRRPEHHLPSQRHLRAQQAASQQADLAVLANLRP